MMYHQIENVNRKVDIIKKEPNRNLGVEKYSNWKEKVTRKTVADLSWQKSESVNLKSGSELEVRTCFQSEQQKESSGNMNRTLKICGTPWSIQHTHNGSPRKKREIMGQKEIMLSIVICQQIR